MSISSRDLEAQGTYLFGELPQIYPSTILKMPPATSAFAEEHQAGEKKFDRRASPNDNGIEVASTDLQDHRKLEKAILRKLDIR